MSESSGRAPREPDEPQTGDGELHSGFRAPVPADRAPSSNAPPAGGGWSPPAPETAQRPVFHQDGEPAGERVLVLSGWWRRVGAALVDALIVGSIAIAIGVALGVADADAAGQTVGNAITLILLMVIALYAPLMMWRTNGRTVGRMVTGIRVVRANGEPMTLGVAVTREVLVKSLLVGLVSRYTLGVAGLINVLWPLWDRENRALHDFPVDTRTIIVD